MDHPVRQVLLFNINIRNQKDDISLTKCINTRMTFLECKVSVGDRGDFYVRYKFCPYFFLSLNYKILTIMTQLRGL